MSNLDRHIKQPDVGVVASDLFIYEASKPYTGGLVANVLPDAIEGRETVLLDTKDLRVLFLMDRDKNTAQATLIKKGEPETQDRHTFRLAEDFQTKEQVALTILFADAKIVAVIDGQPLYIRP